MLLRARRERLFRTYAANDLDSNVILFWSMLRDYPTELSERLWRWYQLYGDGDNDEVFAMALEKVRNGNEMERATALYYIHKCTIKGVREGRRVRSKIRRNGLHPHGLERLPLYSELLQGVSLTNLDYREISIPKDAFLFLDPTYEHRNDLYNQTVDLSEFAEWATSLRCSWMVTLNDSPFTNSLFAEFDRLVEPVRYSKLLDLKSRLRSASVEPHTELVIFNFARPSRQAFARRFGWKMRRGFNAA